MMMMMMTVTMTLTMTMANGNDDNNKFVFVLWCCLTVFWLSCGVFIFFCKVGVISKQFKICNNMYHFLKDCEQFSVHLAHIMTTRAAAREMNANFVSKMTEFSVITFCDRGAVGFDVTDPAFSLKDLKMPDATKLEWHDVEGGPETEPLQKLLQWLKERHLHFAQDDYVTCWESLYFVVQDECILNETSAMIHVFDSYKQELQLVLFRSN